jgi:plastocyanin
VTDQGSDPDLLRRTLLKAAGVSAGLSLGAGAATSAAAQEDGGDGGANGPPEDPPAGATSIDPVFGLPSAGPNPCAGDAGTDCLDEFPQPTRPDHEVEMEIGLPGPLLALAGQGGISRATTASVNDIVADGQVVARDLHRPDASVTIHLPDGKSTSLTVTEIANLVADTRGFFFDPAGLHVQPGDVVTFSAETPDHAVAAYHERHGRQNRVPDSVPPIASPQIPVGGSWRYRFEKPGVYDCYCPPHQTFGMVWRVVVYGGSGPVPSLDVERTGRPPDDENVVPGILSGLDPNLPSSMAALETDVLDPENIVENGPVSWSQVVAAHRGS